MITVVETTLFTRQIEDLFEPGARDGVIAFFGGGPTMSQLGSDLISALTEAVAHAEGRGPALIEHAPVEIDVKRVRIRAGLTQAQIAPMLGVSVSGYRKWEQGHRRVSGPVLTLLRIIEREPEAVKRALSV